MFRLWRTFNSVVFYLTLGVGLGELVGNRLVLWHLCCHIKKGPFFLYVLYLAAMDFLFLACQMAFSIIQVTLGSDDTLYFAITFTAFSVGLWLLAAFSTELCLSTIVPSCYGHCQPRHTSGRLLFFCSLLLVFCWSLRPLLSILLPALAPLPALLDYVRGSCRLLLHLAWPPGKPPSLKVQRSPGCQATGLSHVPKGADPDRQSQTDRRPPPRAHGHTYAAPGGSREVSEPGAVPEGFQKAARRRGPLNRGDAEADGSQLVHTDIKVNAGIPSSEPGCGL
ncbi:mas-related G-protein coupled receptor member G [Equus przewalskii]|uniref:Mas-related G-protein coupled receptor member G n=1 Tax=Equus przewalskii TaxID=9798 RepID=A0ABM2EHB2_EQUPR